MSSKGVVPDFWETGYHTGGVLLHAVVLLLTKDYMRKKWPMWELDIALKRCSMPKPPVTVLPVLLDISIEELGDLSSQVYHDDRWTGGNKPKDENLQRWAALGKEVTTLVQFGGH